MHAYLDAATASHNAITIDSTLLALIPIATALMAIVAGVVGAWVQSRREHSRWIRERRYEAYTELDEILTRLDGLRAAAERSNQPGGNLSEDRRIWLEELPGPLSRVNLLGPSFVLDAKNAWWEAENGSDTDRNKAADALLRAMRRALDVRM